LGEANIAPREGLPSPLAEALPDMATSMPLTPLASITTPSVITPELDGVESTPSLPVKVEEDKRAEKPEEPTKSTKSKKSKPMSLAEFSKSVPSSGPSTFTGYSKVATASKHLKAPKASSKPAISKGVEKFIKRFEAWSPGMGHGGYQDKSLTVQERGEITNYVSQNYPAYNFIDGPGTGDHPGQQLKFIHPQHQIKGALADKNATFHVTYA